MAQNKTEAVTRARGFWLLLALLAVIFSVMFYESFQPGKVIFNNDGPLGAISSQAALLPSGYHGLWQDLNWIGGESIGASPDFSNTLALVTRPVGFSKCYAPIACLVLGLCTWILFRQLGFRPQVCFIGGLAAALNSDFVSTACWGVAAQPVCFGANYLALAALVSMPSGRPWIKIILAGFAVGWGVMEGFDIGAIFSLVVAAYVVFQTLNVEGRRPGGKDIALGFARVAAVAVFAALIAVQTVNTLVTTQIKGVMGTAQDEQTRQAQWSFSTQWSVPKKELAQVFIPGVFGYRMFDGDSHLMTNSYWGTVGANPMVFQIDKLMASSDEQAQAAAASLKGDYTSWRFSGTGFYVGIPVLVIALWGAAQAFRRKDSPYSRRQRRAVLFWAVVAVSGLLLALGKYAPFYWFFYSLPYASTIRNPLKFMHVFSWALLILFGYGLDSLVRNYMERTPANRVTGVWAQFKNWRAKASPFERKWMTGCGFALGLGLLGFFIYASEGSDLRAYIQSVGVGPALAPALAKKSLEAVGWFEVFLLLTVTFLALTLSGQFAGSRSRWGCGLIGFMIVVDLVRADLPWITYWDYPYKYATNPVIDSLRDKPYEHRTVMAPLGGPDERLGLLRQLYEIEWKQQVFPYYNIQSLDIVQEPRETSDNNAFRQAVSGRNPATLARLWELTNTRYMLGPAGGADALNAQIDPFQRRFRTQQRFDLVPKGNGSATSLTDLTAAPDTNGPLAVIEFTGALPRTRLYSNWQVITNRETTLSLLSSPEFNPAKTVLVMESIPASERTSINQEAGTAQIKPNYESKRVEIEADAKAPAILLLNDKFNPRWQVWVDGKPGTLLHCNFIMRGVYLEPGHHNIVMRYVVSMTTFYISVLMVLTGLGLCGWLALGAGRTGSKTEMS